MTEQYKQIVRTILNDGVLQDCRNGTQLIIPHYSFTLDFSKGPDTAKLKLRKIHSQGRCASTN